MLGKESQISKLLLRVFLQIILLRQKMTSSKRFLQKISISNGKILQPSVNSQEKDSKANELEVVRVEGESMGLLYCRLVPLVLLLVDGSNPIDVTDPDWQMYLVVEKKSDQQDIPQKLLGFAALYRVYFFHYPDSHRLRLDQGMSKILNWARHNIAWADSELGKTQYCLGT